MDSTPELSSSTELGPQNSMALQKYEPRIIVVAVDATRELQLAALMYALDISDPGDKLYLLGILHLVNNPMGYKQKADPLQFNGTNNTVILDQQRKKEAEYKRCMNDPELQKLFASKHVTPVVQIAPGKDRKVVIATEAGELRATWVVLDKHLKGDKSYLVEKLNCNLVLLKAKNQQPVMIKAGREQIEDGNLPRRFQATLADDKSIDLGPAQIMDDMSPKALLEPVSKSIMESTISFAASSVAPSSSSLQRLDSVKISTQTPEEYSHSNDRQSARTELSSITFSESPGDYFELDTVYNAQFSDHADSSSAKGTSSTGFRRDDVQAVDDKDRQTEYTILENFDSESEDDTLTPAAVPKVGSVGSSSEQTYYQIPSRPSMSTGDLQSLMQKSSSVATLYRPALQNASDKAGDELKNILTPPSSTPSSAGTPRSVRTLQRSLQEEDLIFQSPNSSNSTASPIGRVNKFGSQNEDNRFLLDNSVHARRKLQRPFAPPLCSHCKTPGPEFGKDAIKFTYAELEEATNNFDQDNYIAEGGYGFVYRGRLKGGQEIAVKQYKAASSQGDNEFFSEVDVLKHAQHRNLVILIGYCIEEERRLLVYEFVCNKSLDVHLSAKNVNVLQWQWRWKIAVGAARGLRYLHEECRVGCIVHRDMRPNNILLTHDYVPMVGDFGLARSQTSGDEAEETRVIGTLGYLAPEYAETGSITEKADVYSFGVVLLELITGRKAIDATKARGETCLTEWARPVIQAGKTGNIVDPRLKGAYDIEQVDKMVDAAGRCICKDPAQRPKMSEVIRLLERDANSESSFSRRNSVSDLTAEIARHEILNKLPVTSGQSIHRERSLDSVSTRSSSRRNGASGIQLKSKSNNPQSTAIPTQGTGGRSLRISKSEKIERISSPRQTLSLTIKSVAARAKPKSGHRLSYGDMLT